MMPDGLDEMKSSVTSMVDSVGQLLEQRRAPPPPSALLAPPQPPKPPPSSEATGYWTWGRMSPPPAPSILRQAKANTDLLLPQSLSPWVLPDAETLREHEAQLLGRLLQGPEQQSDIHSNPAYTIKLYIMI